MKRDDQGILIIFEGIDGAGKTTQARRVTEWLKAKGLLVALFSEPTHGEYGQKLRQIMAMGRSGVSAEEELDLFLKDRQENVQKNILPALAQGSITIVDRYYFSSMAYQGALGLDIGMIRAMNEAIAPEPDLVIILEVDVHQGIHRIETFRQERLNHFEKAEYLHKVDHIFRQMLESYITHVPTSLPLEEVNASVDQLVFNILISKGFKSIG